jgi:hypothetical protein
MVESHTLESVRFSGRLHFRLAFTEALETKGDSGWQVPLAVAPSVRHDNANEENEVLVAGQAEGLQQGGPRQGSRIGLAL